MSHNQVSHLQSWFNSVDRDHSGGIDQTELSQMTMPGEGAYAGRILGHAAAAQLIKLFDLNNDGTIGRRNRMQRNRIIVSFINCVQQIFLSMPLCMRLWKGYILHIMEVIKIQMECWM